MNSITNTKKKTAKTFSYWEIERDKKKENLLKVLPSMTMMMIIMALDGVGSVLYTKKNKTKQKKITLNICQIGKFPISILLHTAIYLIKSFICVYYLLKWIFFSHFIWSIDQSISWPSNSFFMWRFNSLFLFFSRRRRRHRHHPRMYCKVVEVFFSYFCFFLISIPC